MELPMVGSPAPLPAVHAVSPPPDDRPLWALVLLVLAVLLLNTLISCQSILTLFANAGWTARTQKVLAVLAAVHATLQDAESGQRGYLSPESRVT
jgi:MYXO-CTERM domain-containing protein